MLIPAVDEHTASRFGSLPGDVKILHLYPEHPASASRWTHGNTVGLRYQYANMGDCHYFSPVWRAVWSRLRWYRLRQSGEV